jgi:hypothetical protein
MIMHLSENVYSEFLHDSALKHFPEEWGALIGLKEKFEVAAKTNDEESNKGSVKKHLDEVDFFLNEMEDSKQQFSKKKTQPPPPQPPPKAKQIIQNQDDDILGMLEDLENNIVIAPPINK